MSASVGVVGRHAGRQSGVQAGTKAALTGSPTCLRRAEVMKDVSQLAVQDGAPVCRHGHSNPHLQASPWSFWTLAAARAAAPPSSWRLPPTRAGTTSRPSATSSARWVGWVAGRKRGRPHLTVKAPWAPERLVNGAGSVGGPNHHNSTACMVHPAMCEGRAVDSAPHPSPALRQAWKGARSQPREAYHQHVPWHLSISASSVLTSLPATPPAAEPRAGTKASISSMNTTCGAASPVLMVPVASRRAQHDFNHAHCRCQRPGSLEDATQGGLALAVVLSHDVCAVDHQQQRACLLDHAPHKVGLASPCARQQPGSQQQQVFVEISFQFKAAENPLLPSTLHSH